MVGIARVGKLPMKINKRLVLRLLSAGMEILGYFVKKDLARYNITITDVIDAGRDSGMTILTVIDSLKDYKLTPEETLELAERLTVNKRSLDNALTTLIKDLQDYAIEKTKEDENA